MSIGVYGIFCIKSNRCLYVGQSRDMEYRWKKHRQTLLSRCHKRKDFVEWVDKFGIDSIYFAELEICQEDELNSSEIYWFNRLLPEFYGKRPSNKDKWTHSEKTREKISKTMKKRLGEGKTNRIKACMFCGNLFEFSRKRKMYCSPHCFFKSCEHSDEFRARIKKMYESGMSLREIAKIEGKSHISIYKRLLRDGVSMR